MGGGRRRKEKGRKEEEIEALIYLEGSLHSQHLLILLPLAT
jgi:hypothetical protein